MKGSVNWWNAMIMAREFIGFDVSFHRPAVVFLHAFPMNRWMWIPQMEALAQHGFSCVTLDYPGFGQAPPWNFSPTIDSYAQYVFTVMEQLRIPRAIFVGLSMGGYVAFALYRQRPELFQGLVLANTRATADTEEVRKRRLRLIEDVRKAQSPDPVIDFHIEKFFTPHTRRQHPQVVQQAVTLMRTATPIGIIQALWAMADRPDSTDLLPRMGFPVLVIAGSDDGLTTPAEAESMAQAIPQADLVTISQAAHLSNMEQPADFNRALLQYLQKVLS